MGWLKVKAVVPGSKPSDYTALVINTKRIVTFHELIGDWKKLYPECINVEIHNNDDSCLVKCKGLDAFTAAILFAEENGSSAIDYSE